MVLFLHFSHIQNRAEPLIHAYSNYFNIDFYTIFDYNISLLCQRRRIECDVFRNTFFIFVPASKPITLYYTLSPFHTPSISFNKVNLVSNAIHTFAYKKKKNKIKIVQLLNMYK